MVSILQYKPKEAKHSKEKQEHNASYKETVLHMYENLCAKEKTRLL